jgi:hypothetical protein
MNRISSDCSFCGRSESEVGDLLPGLFGASICLSCIEQSSLFPTNMNISASCGFCGGKQKEVSKLLSGKESAICSACIEGMLYPSVLTRSGFIVNPRTRIGSWLLNSKNRFIRKYVMGE